MFSDSCDNDMHAVSDSAASTTTSATPTNRTEPAERKQSNQIDADKNLEKPEITIPKIVPLPSWSNEGPRRLARGLEGKFVDEFGNILDSDGTVHGRVEGDLPSMIGRPVASDGSIIDSDGNVCGHVSENLVIPPLNEVGYGLRVDAEGKIYDMDGQNVGKMKTPASTSQNATAAAIQGSDETEGTGNKKRKASHSLPEGVEASTPRPRPATPSPSEIYLDVKSTHDGIQLIIKIPTVFNRDQGSGE